MKFSVLAVSVFLAGVLAITACGGSEADKYVGKWHVTDGNGGYWVDIEIVRNGESYIVIDKFDESRKMVAALQNGILKIDGECSIAYIKASNRLIASGCGENTYEYERIQ